MAFSFQQTSHPDIEQLLRQYSQRLSDKDRRRLAAREAIQLGHGGIRSSAQVLAWAPHTVQDGMRELPQLPDDPAGRRVRKPGGGRKKTAVQHADLSPQGQDTLHDRIAGAPMRQDMGWTDLPPQAMPTSLRAHAVGAGPRRGRRMRAGLGVARRHRRKGLPGGAAPHREAPWRHLAHLMQALLAAGTPVVRMETKQKAYVGTLSREGKGDGQQARTACAQDFPSLARGVIMPHGLDDLARHQGWRQVGRSRDTTACACESLRFFGPREGRRLSSNASALVLWCEGGGRNSGHTPRSQEDLQALVHALDVPMRVAHSPADGSQCTPIERRLCSPGTRAGQGGLFDALPTVRGLIQKTKTPQGLSVTVRVLDKRSAGGRPVSEAFKKHRPIVCDTVLPKWHYWAMPQGM